MRATELKCLQRTSKGVRAARKGTRGLLPGVESWSSKARVFDGTLKPNPEDSLHYCLLLGDGDINDRGEGDEGFNTPVCRPRGVQKTSMRGPSSGRNRACAKADLIFNACASRAPGRPTGVQCFPASRCSPRIVGGAKAKTARSTSGEVIGLSSRAGWVRLPHGLLEQQSVAKSGIAVAAATDHRFKSCRSDWKRPEA